MGRRITLQVPIVKVEGDDVFKGHDDIGLDSWVCPFVDGKGAGGMGVEQVAHTVLDVCLGQLFVDRPGNIKHFHLAAGSDADGPFVHICPLFSAFFW